MEILCDLVRRGDIRCKGVWWGSEVECWNWVGRDWAAVVLRTYFLLFPFILSIPWTGLIPHWSLVQESNIHDFTFIFLHLYTGTCHSVMDRNYNRQKGGSLKYNQLSKKVAISFITVYNLIHCFLLRYAEDIYWIFLGLNIRDMACEQQYFGWLTCSFCEEILYSVVSSLI